MAVHDRGGLADNDAVMDGHEHVVAWLGKIGGEPLRVDRLVEHLIGDVVEHRLFARPQPSDLDLGHRCSLSCSRLHVRAAAETGGTQ